jgi:hypothetical protein
MTDTTIAPPRRGRRPAHSRRPLPIRRRRRSRAVQPPLAASEALVRLAAHGDVFDVGGCNYLVAPIDDDTLDTLVDALGAIEDDEENGDREPSVDRDDLESDGLEGESDGLERGEDDGLRYEG